MKILTIIGARPQFIKASMISNILSVTEDIEEVLVHTGQHYDDNMSSIFFQQMNLPKPDHYLGIGSGTHGKQTAQMLIKLEEIMFSVKPDIVLVYGDTNSTLAGSLAAAKLHIPVAHIEAGLRSFNKKMPEEINRIMTDHLSHWLFCPSNTALQNLKNEGITERVYQTGDIMYDALLHFQPYAQQQSTIIKDLCLTENNYYLATIHRAENTDDPKRLEAILTTLQSINEKIILPLHPRTKSKLKNFKLTNLLSSPHINIVEPLNYFDMITIISHAKLVLTDSGGLQKEAYMLKKPCITLREETEWTETVETGWNHLTGVDSKLILHTLTSIQIPKEHPPLFGDGNTSKKIIEILTRDFKNS